jgi:N-carbamoylputrescine amidase
MKLAIVQLAANPSGDCALARAIQLVADAAAQGAEVIVLPELFRWEYPGQTVDPSKLERAETTEGETVRALASAAANHGVVVLVPFMERRGAGVVSNSVAVLGTAGELLGVYRKSHLPDDPHFHEKYYFTPGDEPHCVVETPFGTIGVLICWDQWFPEAARLAALQGAEVLVYPTAIGSIAGESEDDAATQLDAWQTIQRGHAIANGVYVAAVNRVGQEGDIGFWGHSFVAAPFGEVLVDLERAGDAIAVVDVSSNRVAEVRRTWPFFRDRRVDLYEGIGRRWRS